MGLRLCERMLRVELKLEECYVCNRNARLTDGPLYWGTCPDCRRTGPGNRDPMLAAAGWNRDQRLIRAGLRAEIVAVRKETPK